MQQKSHEILIVDDNPENLRVLSAVLEQEGYEVRAATNGQQALDSIAAAEPDLILLDVHLPEMNGLEVCRTIKKDPKHEDLPIIFLSALSDSFNKLQGFEAGAIDYMTKPFDAEEVKIRVKTHLDLRARLREVKSLRQEIVQKDEVIRQLKAELGRDI